jgi:hypothetical protein
LEIDFTLSNPKELGANIMDEIKRQREVQRSATTNVDCSKTSALGWGVYLVQVEEPEDSVGST